MDDIKDPQAVRQTVEITEQGAITQLTGGVALPFPFYEQGIPPYDHFWPPP